MYLRKVFILNLLVSLIMSQEQLGADIDGEAAGDYWWFRLVSSLGWCTSI